MLRLSPAHSRQKPNKDNQATNMRATTIAALLALALFASGCASEWRYKRGDTSTGSVLGGGTYRIVKRGAKGESSGFKLLGIVPFVMPTASTAQVRLYESV